MNNERLEHVNMTVKNIDEVLRFLRAALPTWRVRGEGTMDWYGKPIRWLHVGTDHSYLALQDGGEGEVPHWTSHGVGAKHLGIAVDSVDAVVERLGAAGFALDHWASEHPQRRRVYVIDPGSLQFEFIEYRSALAAERNAYDVAVAGQAPQISVARSVGPIPVVTGRRSST